MDTLEELQTKNKITLFKTASVSFLDLEVLHNKFIKACVCVFHGISYITTCHNLRVFASY